PQAHRAHAFPAPAGEPADPAALFLRTRAYSRWLATPLGAEDAQLQSMPEASPAKWHLAHTTWFFARFVLDDPDAIPPGWDALFNSYYVTAGDPHPRPRRGMLSRPSLADVLAWRDDVDARILCALESGRLDPARHDIL